MTGRRALVNCALLAIAGLVLASSLGLGADETVTVTIYNTGDLHDHSGTLARIAGFVKEQKKKDPNVLFVDAGDFLNKGEAQMAATQGEGMVHLMSLAGYDAVTLGNHDYIYGKDRMLDLKEKYPAFPLVLCNMRWEGADKERAKGIPRYKVFDLKGVRVAVSAGGSHYTNHTGGTPFPMFHEREGYNEILPEIKGKADVFIFISHIYNGSDQGLIGAWKENAPHVLIGGHTHERKIWTFNDTLIVKAGAIGDCLGQTTIKWDPAQKKIVSKAARIIGVGKDWLEDPAVKAAREQYFKPAAPPQPKPAAEEKKKAA